MGSRGKLSIESGWSPCQSIIVCYYFDINKVVQRAICAQCRSPGFAPFPAGAESRGSSSASAELDGLKRCGVSPPAPRLGWGPAAVDMGTGFCGVTGFFFGLDVYAHQGSGDGRLGCWRGPPPPPSPRGGGGKTGCCVTSVTDLMVRSP